MFWLWLSLVWETHKLTRYQGREFSCYIHKSKQTQKHIRVSLQLARADLIIHSQRETEVLFSTLKNLPFPFAQSIKLHIRDSHSSLWKICKRISQLSQFDHATWQHPRENPRHVRGSARIYDVRMAHFVLKIEKLSHIIGARGSQDLRSPSPIMAPDNASLA